MTITWSPKDSKYREISEKLECLCSIIKTQFWHAVVSDLAYLFYSQPKLILGTEI